MCIYKIKVLLKLHQHRILFFSYVDIHNIIWCILNYHKIRYVNETIINIIKQQAFFNNKLYLQLIF